MPHIGRTTVIVGSVLALHGGALWALNQGLLPSLAEIIVPVQILADLVAPPAPPLPVPTPQPKAPPPPAPVARPRVTATPRPAPAPQPLAVPDAAPTAPVVAAAPPQPAPPAESPAPPVPPAPVAVVQLPSAHADYLNNPKPPYPVMSRRLGESGRVVVRVLIGLDGHATQARIDRSSGFERLDRLALETARDRWRYVPGTRNGVPQEMWFDVPFDFVLE